MQVTATDVWLKLLCMERIRKLLSMPSVFFSQATRVPVPRTFPLPARSVPSILCSNFGNIITTYAACLLVCLSSFEALKLFSQTTQNGFFTLA